MRYWWRFQHCNEIIECFYNANGGEYMFLVWPSRIESIKQPLFGISWTHDFDMFGIWTHSSIFVYFHEVLAVGKVICKAARVYLYGYSFTGISENGPFLGVNPSRSRLIQRWNWPVSQGIFLNICRFVKLLYIVPPTSWYSCYCPEKALLWFW